MRQRIPWLVFGAALIVLAGVMAWVTLKLVALERERERAEQRGAHQEQIRLALWRLDTDLAPLLSQEVAAVAALALAPEAADELPRPEEIRARFALSDEGALQVLVSADDDARDALQGLLGRTDLWAAAPASDDERTRGLLNPTTSGEAIKNVLSKSRQSQGGGYFGSRQQTYRSVNELSNRAQAVDRSFSSYQQSVQSVIQLQTQAAEQAADGEGRWSRTPGVVTGGPARPVWVGAELVVVRRVEVDGKPVLQGSWLDWERLRRGLLASVEDLVPEAELLPAEAVLGVDDLVPEAELLPTEAASGAEVPHLLATLPVRLDPGPPPSLADIEGPSPLLPSLVLGWLGTLAAAVAVFLVLRWSLALSERRAAFVSAVTHELRTPLTTFRMYAEMLAEGMVDQAKRARYVTTLRREADRLGDLVENVLAYSRLESDRAPLTPEVLRVQDLLDRVRERLAERSRAAGLELALELPDAVAGIRVRVDPTAAEQILFNLVDNAAKYAPSREIPRLELRAVEGSPKSVALEVRDHGPGVDPREREAIFAPFAKARAHASGAKPGVGLGLALSRRLARQLGGDLRVEAADPGARFILTLPRAVGG